MPRSFALLLMALAVLPACTGGRPTTRLRADRLLLHDSTSKAFVPPLDEDALESAQEAEVQRALGEIWALASTVDAHGAQWEFRYWYEQGALTPLSFRHVERGHGRVAPADKRAFQQRLARALPTLLGTNAKEVTLSLEREETGWDVDLDSLPRDETPPSVRTLPSPNLGISGATYQQVQSLAHRLQHLMRVPQGGSTRLEVQITLDDSRVSGWRLSRQDISGRGPDALASDMEVSLVVHVLGPFLHALGERTVTLMLVGNHAHGDTRAHWRVVEARMLEPSPLPRELKDVGREYLAMRERILLDSEAGMREGAIFLAGFSLEQVATMLVGGFLLKRALLLFEAAAPTVTSFLARGGHGAVRWLRNLLLRMPAAEREALQRLWLKAETQGLKALTEAEKAQLQTLMGRMEAILRVPLKEKRIKDQFREWARREYFEVHRPDVARALGKSRMNSYQVHHEHPLEYAHRFPNIDLNGKANLAAVHEEVHLSINRVWRIVRPLSEKMTPQELSRVVEIVNRHYSRWFHKVYDADSAALARAEQAALAEVKALLAR